MKVKNSNEVLDVEGIFIYGDEEGNCGLIITEDLGYDFGEVEVCRGVRDIDINGKTLRIVEIYS
jgi:hypothetical protein